MAEKIRTNPVRFGILDDLYEDSYLISPESNGNVKLRQSAGTWILKLKYLIEAQPGGIELYRENPALVCEFPVTPERIGEAARLLKVGLQDDFTGGRYLFTREQFLDILSVSNPPVKLVTLPKTRSQFKYDEGWIELASVKFPHGQEQTISVNAYNLSVVQMILQDIKPGPGLRVMNYVDACRLLL